MANPSIAPTRSSAVDQDLATQAHPGFGIPSQDPRPGAQSPLTPKEARREADSMLAGAGVAAGVAAGAAIGAAVAGPVGAVIGAPLGGVAGALGGAASGAMAALKSELAASALSKFFTVVHSPI